MEKKKTQREMDAYYRRKLSGGRNAFARGLDYAALRLILFAGAYLFFAARIPSRGRALLLAGVFLAIAMLVLRIRREVVLERFIERERGRIRDMLLTERLLLLSESEAERLCGGMASPGERAILLRRTKPAEEDALLQAVSKLRPGERAALFAPAGFTPEAEALAKRISPPCRLCGKEALVKGAGAAGLTPTGEEIAAYIQGENGRRKRRVRGMRGQPFAPGNARKYLVTAVLLTGVSFFTGYALYYRMLAGLCMTISAWGAWINRNPAGRENIV